MRIKNPNVCRIIVFMGYTFILLQCSTISWTTRVRFSRLNAINRHDSALLLCHPRQKVKKTISNSAPFLQPPAASFFFFWKINVHSQCGRACVCGILLRQDRELWDTTKSKWSLNRAFIVRDSVIAWNQRKNRGWTLNLFFSFYSFSFFSMNLICEKMWHTVLHWNTTYYCCVGAAGCCPCVFGKSCSSTEGNVSCFILSATHNSSLSLLLSALTPKSQLLK